MTSMSIPLYWWRDLPNFGDGLSPLIVSYVSRKNVRFCDAPGKLLAVGSILGFAARKGDTVWGSGILWPQKLPDGLHVHAVRGPLTREVFLRQGFECPPVYGDPAWLMPMFYRPVIEKKYETAVLPHHSDVWLKQIASESPVKLLSTGDPPFRVIDGILAAKRLVTSSLHGLIMMRHLYTRLENEPEFQRRLNRFLNDDQFLIQIASAEFPDLVKVDSEKRLFAAFRGKCREITVRGPENPHRHNTICDALVLHYPGIWDGQLRKNALRNGFLDPPGTDR